MYQKLKGRPEKVREIKQKWNELFAKPVMEKRNIFIFTIGLLVVVIVQSIVIAGMSLKDNLVVGIMQVDDIGKTTLVGQAKKTVMDDDLVIRGHLYSFIEMARSIITDPEAMRTNLTRAYEMVTPEVKNFLNTHYSENNPMESAREKSRQVTLSSFLKHSKQTYIIEWNEIERDLSNKVIGRTKWKALMTVTQEFPKTYKEMESRLYNPFGIYIKSLSWSKVL